MSTRSASIDLPPTAASAIAARRLVRELLRVWEVPHDHEDACLLVTELVANVVDHVGGEANLTLELSLSETWLRIAVVDGSSIRPVVQELSHDRPRGRGMRMVEGIADRWGAEDHDGGKRVWFDMFPAQDWTSAGLTSAAIGDGGGTIAADPRSATMSEPSGKTQAAGEGVSDEEMVQTVAEQTDSASENADTAGKDWNGDPSGEQG